MSFKNLFLLGLAICLPSSLFAQGTVIFVNRGGTGTTTAPGQTLAPIYYDLSGNGRISGNTSTGVPAGNTSYGTAPFLNADTGGGTWIATLWGLPSGLALGDAANNNLRLLVNSDGRSSTTFRANPPAVFNGIFNQLSEPMIVPGVVTPGPGTATFQVRVWDTKSGRVNTWSEVLADSTVLYGYSDLFMNAYSLGGTENSANPPPFLQGLQSFNIFIPEPSVIVIASLAVGCVMTLSSCARRKGNKVQDKV